MCRRSGNKFPHSASGDDSNGTYFIGLLWRLNEGSKEEKARKCIEQYFIYDESFESYLSARCNCCIINTK